MGLGSPALQAAQYSLANLMMTNNWVQSSTRRASPLPPISAARYCACAIAAGCAWGRLPNHMSRKKAYDCPDSSRKACTDSNNFMRFFSITIAWVPSASCT